MFHYKPTQRSLNWVQLVTDFECLCTSFLVSERAQKSILKLFIPVMISTSLPLQNVMFLIENINIFFLYCLAIFLAVFVKFLDPSGLLFLLFFRAFQCFKDASCQPQIPITTTKLRHPRGGGGMKTKIQHSKYNALQST